MFRSNTLATGVVLSFAYPLLVAASLAALATFSGCSKSSNVSGMGSAQQGPEWAVQLQSSCGNTALEECTAGYPYTVGADGLYRVGPGPQGQTFTGKLPADEFAELQKLYFESAASAQAPSGDTICAQSTTDTELSNDKITFISNSGNQVEWIHTNDLNICSRLSSPESTQKLLTFMRDSAARHYPLPFPDGDCDNALVALETLYGKVRECTTDADCAFIDESFQSVAKDYLTFLIRGDCTGAPPLIVANRERVAAKRSLLLQFFSNTQDACKARAASRCDGFSDFQPTRPAPVCGGGICRARSG